MWIPIVLIVIFTLNTIAAIVTVFKQPRDIAATWAWLLVLLLLPVIGFLIYSVFGRKLATNKMRQIQTQQRLGIDQLVVAQEASMADGELLPPGATTPGLPELVTTLLKADGALLSEHNQVTVLSQYQPFIDQLLADIAQATHHIHIQAYIFEPDETGLRLREQLIIKAKAGVRVRVMYDALGSHRITQKFWAPLREAGGEVEAFVASKLSRANLRMNFRNHRKIIVIDGQIGYVGGFDLGQRRHKLVIDRDTQLRVVGSAVMSLQAQFFMDWNATAKVQKVHFQPTYFAASEAPGNALMQIVSGGPDQSIEAIKLGYMRMIAMAKESIWMQTPYFVPDDSLLDAISIAAQSGIDVRLMVPTTSNQPTMSRATRYYLNQLVDHGGHVFMYDGGFLHAKSMVVDGRFVATGTANLDIRSFKLNFEVAAFVYDRHVAAEFKQLFVQDMAEAHAYTPKDVANQTTWAKFWQGISRLLAPIL